MNAENTAKRLHETTAKCLSSLEAWNKDLKDTESRQNLLDAVHELRKVVSRLEIDIAMNDRKAVNARPLPIPEHKSKLEKKNNKPLSEILPVAEIKESSKKRKIEIEVNDDNESDTQEDDGKKQRKPRRKKREDNED